LVPRIDLRALGMVEALDAIKDVGPCAMSRWRRMRLALILPKKPSIAALSAQ
jgi:hypothetical protein